VTILVYIFRRTLRSIYLLINKTIGPICEFFVDKWFQKRHGCWFPIFIVGAPRCGSTLIMQTFTDAFDVGYIANAHCRWFGAPALADKIFRPLTNKQPSDFTSTYGQTKKNSDPSECAAWWYRFFRREPAYVTSKDVSVRKMQAFRRSVASLGRAMERPLIFKNLYAGLRIEPIVDTLPGSLFVVVERDLLDNAQSILKGRQETGGSYEPWWSVPPPNVEELRQLPPVQQVVEQIRSIYQLLERDIDRFDLEERTFRIRYEEFCADVHGTLDAFEAFMRRHGVPLERRFTVPQSFKVSRGHKIPKKMYAHLINYLQHSSGKDDIHPTEVRGDV